MCDIVNTMLSTFNFNCKKTDNNKCNSCNEIGCLIHCLLGTVVSNNGFELGISGVSSQNLNQNLLNCLAEKTSITNVGIFSITNNEYGDATISPYISVFSPPILYITGYTLSATVGNIDLIILFFQNSDIIKKQFLSSKYFLCSYNNNYFNTGEKCLFFPVNYLNCSYLNVPKKQWYDISSYVNVPTGDNMYSPWVNYFLTKYIYNNIIFNVNLIIFTYTISPSSEYTFLFLPTPLKYVVYPIKIKINNQNETPLIFIYSDCNIYSSLQYVSLLYNVSYTTTFICGECYDPKWLIYSYYSVIGV